MLQKDPTPALLHPAANQYRCHRRFRDNDAMIPSGNDVLLPGDRIIIFAAAAAVRKVEYFLRLEV